MRPYIIINGMNSALVDGLLISDLPDIIKPQMRSNQVVIDGRDGDVVQTLGYSSYEKEITIGLYGKYDIDRVISYFNDSGEVIFSNEPDKIYKYTILDEISYEKLNRFKKAKVKFHVQPFKYSAIESTWTFTTQLLKLGSGSQTLNGHTLSWNGHQLTLSGSSSQDNHFFIPISLKAMAGAYDVKITSSRENGGCQFRICQGSPINIQSLGGQAFSEGEDTTVNASKSTEYKYLYVYVPSGSQTATITININSHQFEIINRGNVYSRPLLDIYGSGQITLSINGTAILVMNINDGNLIIDGEGMNAYKGNVLYNRSVLGNYSNVVLNPDHNIISWTGNVTKINVDNYSRWI